LPPPQDIPDVPRTSPPLPAVEPLLDTSVAADATRIQQRLIELGFLVGPADGKWGPRSKEALREFRATRQLGVDSTWDEKTQSLLLDVRQASTAAGSAVVSPYPSAAFAQNLWGGWTATQGECGEPPDPPPMTISAAGASTFGGYCQFNSVRQEAANVWRVAARCTVGQQSWSTSIQLTLTPAALKWSSAKGEQLYYRCSAMR
jgi:peptidoglycan hydrolase-like protein with peptidoglycan-binding domain